MIEFASLRRADLSNATLHKGKFTGSGFTNANVARINFDGVDLNAARIGKLKNRSAAKNLDKAKN